MIDIVVKTSELENVETVVNGQLTLNFNIHRLIKNEIIDAIKRHVEYRTKQANKNIVGRFGIDDMSLKLVVYQKTANGDITTNLGDFSYIKIEKCEVCNKEFIADYKNKLKGLNTKSSWICDDCLNDEQQIINRDAIGQNSEHTAM